MNASRYHRTRRFEVGGRVALIADEYGPLDRPPVILLHGGGQTRHSWGETASHLGAAGIHALSVDLRGHGDSGWSPDGVYGLDSHVRDLRCVIDQLGGPAIVVGASLGGLAGLLAAGEDGGAVRALVLVDVVPAIEVEGAAEIRNFMVARPDGFASVEEAADVVAAYLPDRPRPKENGGLMKNLRLREDGRLHWHWDPAIFTSPSGRTIEEMRARAETAAIGLTIPVLLVRGGQSRVVSLAGVEAFLASVPHARYVNIEGAGHMVAGDRNDAFAAPLLDFLRQFDAPAPSEAETVL